MRDTEDSPRSRPILTDTRVRKRTILNVESDDSMSLDEFWSTSSRLKSVDVQKVSVTTTFSPLKRGLHCERNTAHITIPFIHQIFQFDAKQMNPCLYCPLISTKSFALTSFLLFCTKSVHKIVAGSKLLEIQHSH